MHTPEPRDRTLPFVAFALLLVAGALGAQAEVNRSVHVRSGDVVERSVSSVNGSVRVDDGAEIRAEVSTVNGGIRIGDDCKTRDVSSVNGTVVFGRRGVVDGDVETVNGSLRMADGTRVRGNVETVNGSIELEGVTVERDVETVNGQIRLEDGTVVEGSIIVEENRGSGWDWGRRKPLEIEIDGGSIVRGDVENRDDRREVVVILRDGAVIEGEIRGAEVERR